MASDGVARLEWRGSLDISKVSDVQEELRDALLEATKIELDAASVERADTAMLQLLCSFLKAAEAKNVEVKWVGASEVLLKAAKTLDLLESLELTPLAEGETKS